MTFDWSPLKGKYRVILADPPWRLRTWIETNQKKSPSRHYNLMTQEQINGLPVSDLADDNCLLVLWATQAQLHHAIDTVAAWGFKFKTSGAWAKQSSSGKFWAFGTGYLLRSAAEFFIFAIRGNPKTADRGVRNLIVAPVREHSRKPDEMYENLESMYPNARRCELFARHKRSGWDCWGKEI